MDTQKFSSKVTVSNPFTCCLDFLSCSSLPFFASALPQERLTTAELNFLHMSTVKAGGSRNKGSSAQGDGASTRLIIHTA